MLPAELSQRGGVQTRLPHGRQHCSRISGMLPAELGQLEALQRRALERQQLAKVRQKEQHMVACKRREQAAAEAWHPRLVPASRDLERRSCAAGHRAHRQLLCSPLAHAL